MTKNKKGTYQGGSSQGWRIPPPTGPPARAAGRSPPPSPSPSPKARALLGLPPTGPFAPTPGPFAPMPGHSDLTLGRSAPTQGSPGIFGALPQCPPGTSVAPPRSPPGGPSPPQAPAQWRSLTPPRAAPPPAPRSPRPPGPRTHDGQTPVDAQARPSGHAPSGGNRTCGTTSPVDPTKTRSKHDEATNKRLRGQGQA